MQDVLIQADSRGVYDVVIDEDTKDFESAGGFETAIPLTLFTAARADIYQVQDAKKRRGWAGNLRTFDIEFEIGSQQWIFDQARNTSAIRAEIRAYARRAMQWFVDNGFASDVGVGEIESTQTSASIPLFFTNFENVVTKYMTLWRATDADKLPNN